MSEKVKPPVGLLPRFMWLSLRFKEIDEAINRYTLMDVETPLVWHKEAHIILAELKFMEQVKERYAVPEPDSNMEVVH